MAWAVATVALLGVGVPIGAWSYTRLRPLPSVSRLGAGYDPIDKWLLRHHGLPPPDRGRVRDAVLQGRQVGDPALTAAAHDLGSRVLAGDFRALRLAPVLAWFNTVLAVGFAAAGIVLLVASRHAAGRALGVLGLVDSGMFTFAGVMYRRQAKKIRRTAATALQLNRTADDGAPH